MPLLLIIYNRLTWTFFNVEHLDVVLLELGVFGCLTLTKPKGSRHGMFKTKLLLYRQIFVPSVDFIHLNWWAKHEHQFPKCWFFCIINYGHCEFTNWKFKDFQYAWDYRRIEALSSWHWKFGKANFNHEKLAEKSHIKVHN